MKETLKAALFIFLYGVMAIAIVYVTSQNGDYPSGSDTLFYVYRADALYHSITEEGVFYQLWDPNQYNGVQISRYWAPLCTWVMATCQAVCKGNPYNGYLLFVGLIYFVGAVVWLRIGYTHGRPYLGAFLGLIWFLLPQNIFQLYCDGVLVRSMIFAWLPAYIMAIYDYFQQDRKYSLLKIIIYMFLMVIAHVGYAGMVALATLLYIVYDRICNKTDMRKIVACIIGILVAYMMSGLYLVPSLLGGITSIDSSQVMANFFAPLSRTLNPFMHSYDGSSRWLFDYQEDYFGPVLLALCIIGILFARKRSKAGFLTAFTTVLLTAPLAYPVLVRMPGGSMLWMLRFLTIAICFALMSFLFWDTMKKPLIIIFCVLLLIEAIPSWQAITILMNGETANERYDRIFDETVLGTARDITKQRIAFAESAGVINLDEIYMMSGYEYGEDNVWIAQGQGAQAAITYSKLVQLNQALDDKHYLYFFDRCRELGSDTVLLGTKYFITDEEKEELDKITEAGKTCGYEFVEEKGLGRVYHMNVDGNFGVITEYDAIGIGMGNSNISLGFPSVKETLDSNLSHYTYEELSQYKTVFLSGFTYDNKEEAEELILKLTENGTKVIVFADGIPVDRTTGAQGFLGVTCQQITFNNGFPELTVGPGRFDPDLFPMGYSNWKTVYVNGLDKVMGTFVDGGKVVNFLGTKHNDNLVFLGINLFFHYQLTDDETVGIILSRVFGISPEDLPTRKIVPLTVETSNRGIKITSEYDNVNTTFAYHDIFVTDDNIREENHFLIVDKGETVIKFKYPYFWPGLLVSIAGIILMVLTLKMAVVRRERESKKENVDAIQ
ncbi:MAG: hypothetical protein IK050_06125 [Lachnospiraceae bacterium]|nr:hypothetical protein [Lachnospiraceae bacterium]